MSSLFTDPRCADALVAMLACGFGLREWRAVWDLRAVSPECYHAVQNDDLWRQMYGRLSEGKVLDPPHIKALLRLGNETHMEQRRQRPGLRIGVHFEAFLLGLREAFRVTPTADDLKDLVRASCVSSVSATYLISTFPMRAQTFYHRAKECFGDLAKRQFLCPWWRGEPTTQNVLLPDGTFRATCNPDRLGVVAVGRWYVMQDPHGCTGTYMCVVAPSGRHNLYLVRRLENWAWVLTSPTAVKSSVKLAGRAEVDVVAHEERAASLTELELRQMLRARRMLNHKTELPIPTQNTVGMSTGAVPAR